MTRTVLFVAFAVAAAGCTSSDENANLACSGTQANGKPFANGLTLTRRSR